MAQLVEAEYVLMLANVVPVLCRGEVDVTITTSGFEITMHYSRGGQLSS